MMTTFYSRLCSLLLLTLWLNSVFALGGPPDFPPPPDAHVEWVGNNIEVNGIKSSIRSFHTRKSIERVVEFYRKEWQRPVEKGKPGFMETIDAAPWYIISRIEDGYLMTVQVQVKQNDQSGSWGYLSTSPLTKASPSDVEKIGKNLPKMRGSHVLTETRSNDPGKKARTAIITNTYSVPSNVSFYRNHFRGKGWTLETDKALGNNEVHALVYKTKRNRVTMMFMKDQDYTRIVLNSVTNSIF